MDNQSYLVACVCGRDLAATAGEAGTVVACPWCHEPVDVPRLTRLRNLPLVAGLVEGRSPLQFRLVHLFGLITYLAMALTCGKYIGFLPTVGMCLFAVVWGLACAIKPQPVIYATVLGILLLMTWNLLVCSIQQSRESARRTWATNNLKTIVFEYNEQKTSWPKPANGGTAADQAEFSSFIESRLNSQPAR